MNQNPLNSKWLSLLFIILIGILIFSLLGLNARRAEFQQTVSDTEQKIEAAEKDKAYFEKFIAYFKSPQFLDKQARTKLNYKLPDEEVAFVFRDPNPNKEKDSGHWLEQVPNYQRWWYYVAGY